MAKGMGRRDCRRQEGASRTERVCPHQARRGLGGAWPACPHETEFGREVSEMPRNLARAQIRETDVGAVRDLFKLHGPNGCARSTPRVSPRTTPSIGI